MRQFLLQMSGWNGSGKSTLASAIGLATGAVVLDHDTTKTAIMSADVPHPSAGVASYEVLFGLVADLLRHTHAVVIDSPSVWAAIPERGLALAHAAGVPYFFIECVCPLEVAQARVAARVPRPSQVQNASDSAAIRADPSRIPHQPAFGALVVDTSADVGICLEQVRPYLLTTGAIGPVMPSG